MLCVYIDGTVPRKLSGPQCEWWRDNSQRGITWFCLPTHYRSLNLGLIKLPAEIELDS